jgi:hypothetical protein
MIKKSKYIMLLLHASLGLMLFANLKCAKDPIQTSVTLDLVSKTIDGTNVGESTNYNISRSAVIKISFSTPVKRSSVEGAITFKNKANNLPVSFNIDFENKDSTVVIQAISELQYLTQYSVLVSTDLNSSADGFLLNKADITFMTQLDESDKFPRISDEALLDLVQKQTFKYFWDFGHPISGLARDKTNSDDNDCSIGGSGFGIMNITVAVSRNFISRNDGLMRMQKIVGFLKTKAVRFHGAFPHRINGSTGAVITWSAKDDGADLVETSFMMMGLLTARQYFSGEGLDEVNLRNDINSLYHEVEWDWFTRGENQLYWLWSPNFGWDISFKIKGWNETLISYVLAASSPSHAISKASYDNGFASNGGMKNGNKFYDVLLPLGENYGGCLFLSQYSFMGINPNGLSDAYAQYDVQIKNHALINYKYCIDNPVGYNMYSDSCWGLTACATRGRTYTTCSPTNDNGTIAPTAALSSFPFTPAESMKALNYFYYKLGDKLWGEYGFADSFEFSSGPVWVADQYLVYDQGPIICMIENYRTGLPWNLFMSCPEVKAGMKDLGFSGPNL